jgi:hypothetical protein
MSTSLKNLEIYVNQEIFITPKKIDETPQLDISKISISTNSSSFTTSVDNDNKVISITPLTNFFPYQISYWYKDYNKCPPNKYKFYELSSLTSNAFTIQNGIIKISNLKDLYTPFVRGCENNNRTVAKIIILYSEDPITF